ncbi:uncharacterized protein [Rutidosis leptorrhynchoides]|uniref:uncharacterized protein n=1 Tax=Rutidosis leptorrhynchoides TaxID=125765 RepID=UPI003A99794B
MVDRFLKLQCFPIYLKVSFLLDMVMYVVHVLSFLKMLGTLILLLALNKEGASTMYVWVIQGQGLTFFFFSISWDPLLDRFLFIFEGKIQAVTSLSCTSHICLTVINALPFGCINITSLIKPGLCLTEVKETKEIAMIAPRQYKSVHPT